MLLESSFGGGGGTGTGTGGGGGAAPPAAIDESHVMAMVLHSAPDHVHERPGDVVEPRRVRSAVHSCVYNEGYGLLRGCMLMGTPKALALGAVISCN